jgi:hypothetical protein
MRVVAVAVILPAALVVRAVVVRVEMEQVTEPTAAPIWAAAAAVLMAEPPVLAAQVFQLYRW